MVFDIESMQDLEPMDMPGREVGLVFDYFAHIGVAAVKLTSNLKVGDTIIIRGHTTNFEQRVTHIQINHKEVEEAKAGKEVGIRVIDKVRRHDRIFLVE